MFAIAAVTLLAFALRLAGFGQSLFGDELFTLDDTRGSLSGVFDGLDRNEVSPPLYYLLAWGAAQLGDAITLIRLPSLALGTATVPVVYALGRRALGGGTTALLAATMVALNPFAIFYSVEARPYATMAFLVALSTLALLHALDGGRWVWWVAYATSACAALYTHYTSVFVVLAQAGWALWVHRDRFRELAIVHVAIVVGYLPWLPTLLQQRSDKLTVGIIEAGSGLSPSRISEFLLRLLFAHPYVHLRALPGRIALGLLAIAGATIIGAAAVRLVRSPRALDLRASPDFVLIWIVALATPTGLLAYAAVGSNLYGSRNLTASMPGLAVAVASLVTGLRPRLARAVAALVLTSLAIGAAKSLERDYQRPASRDAAHYIDTRAGSRDSVVTVLAGTFPMDIYFERHHEVFTADLNDPHAWDAASHRANVFVAEPLVGPFRGLARFAGPGGRFVLRDGKVFPGLLRVAIGRYSGEVQARLGNRGRAEVIEWSAGGPIEVRRGPVRGFVETVSARGAAVSIVGWAASPGGQRAPDLVIAFFGKRLFALGVPFVDRPDVAKAYGPKLKRSGYVLTAPADHPERLTNASRLRVFAVSGRTASELKLSETARRLEAGSGG